jgi:predicted ATPase
VALKATYLVFVLALRPLSTSHSTYKNLLQSPGVRHIKLQRLGVEDIKKVVSQALGVAVVPPVVMDTIMAKSQGNPFLAEQLLSALKEQGVINVVFGKIVYDTALDFKTLDIPDNIQGVVLRRMERYYSRKDWRLQEREV